MEHNVLPHSNNIIVLPNTKDQNGQATVSDSCGNAIHVQRVHTDGTIEELNEVCRTVKTSSSESGGLWVAYDGQTLTVSHDADSASSHPAPIITTEIDLSTLFDSSQEMYFGFTAGTGGRRSNHELYGFSFYSDGGDDGDDD